MESDAWNVASLREYLLALLAESDKRNEQRFAAQEKAVAAALQATKEAVLKAEAATEKRFEGVNEFRGQLTDQARTFMSRRESEQQHMQSRERLDRLEAKFDREEGKAGGISKLAAAVLSGVSLLIAIVTVVFALLRS